MEKCETTRKYKPIFFVRCNAAETLLEDAGAPLYVREETEASPIESEYFSTALN